MSINKESIVKSIIVLGALYHLDEKKIIKQGTIEEIQKLISLKLKEDGRIINEWKNFEITNDELLKILKLYEDHMVISWNLSDGIEHYNFFLNDPHAGLHHIIQEHWIDEL